MIELSTSLPGVLLRSLTAQDGPAYAALMASNASHLSRHGDYAEEIRRSAAEHSAAFAAADPRHNFGIYEDHRLVGSVTLVPVQPPRFGLGYLLAESACGHGIATIAVQTAARHARRDLAATELFAGVTHGNTKSVAVLERVGFDRVARFATYDRWHLDLSRSAAADPDVTGAGPPL